MIQKPYDINIRNKTVDIKEDNKIAWKVSGAVQTSYEVNIYTNETNVSVYSSGKIKDYSPSHMLPKNILVNGIEYKVAITVYDEEGNYARSDLEVFKTSSRPIVKLNPMGTVGSNSYNFTGTYEQSEGVKIRNFNFILYNIDKEIIDRSNVKITLPMEHLFSHLDTEQSYYVELQATSAEGLVGTTGLVKFDVFYIRPKLNVKVSYQEIEGSGIELSWYVSQIIGTANGSVFIEPSEIDTTNNRPVIFDKDFTIEKNFTLKLMVRKPYVSNIAYGEDLLVLLNNNTRIYLQYFDDNRFHLFKEQGGYLSHWKSEEVIGSKFYVAIKQVERDLEIHSEVIG